MATLKPRCSPPYRAHAGYLGGACAVIAYIAQECVASQGDSAVARHRVPDVHSDSGLSALHQ